MALIPIEEISKHFFEVHLNIKHAFILMICVWSSLDDYSLLISSLIFDLCFLIFLLHVSHRSIWPLSLLILRSNARFVEMSWELNHYWILKFCVKLSLRTFLGYCWSLSCSLRIVGPESSVSFKFEDSLSC